MSEGPIINYLDDLFQKEKIFSSNLKEKLEQGNFPLNLEFESNDGVHERVTAEARRELNDFFQRPDVVFWIGFSEWQQRKAEERAAKHIDKK